MKKIFIPFVDGLLNYNCQECGYSCCQSGNIIMNTKEKRILLQKYPFLRYFFRKETKKTYTLAKYSACWFLERNGLCYIQKRYGYSLKPLICRLCPFYVARCNGEYIVIPGSCRALCVGRANKNVIHSRILKNAQEAVNSGVIQEKIDWPRKRLNLEKRILKDSVSFLNNSSYLDFSAYQISLVVKDGNTEKIKSELLESIELWKSFLGIDKFNIDNKTLTHELISITPLLRVWVFDLRQMGTDKVPLALLALYFYMIIFSIERKIARYYISTYKQILCDIPLGLLYLKKDDLGIKDKAVEEKISYLRLLHNLHTRNLYRDTQKNVV